MAADTIEQRFIYIPTSALIVSLSLHIIIPLVILSVRQLDRLGFHLFPRKIISKEMYQSFIQVDVVSLPQLLPSEKGLPLDTTLPIVDKPKVEKEEPKPVVKEDTMAFQKEKAKEEAAAADKKAKEAKKLEQEKKRQADEEKALKRLQEEAKREQALKGLKSKTGKTGRAKLAGNVLSQGTSTTGAIGSAKDRYQSLLGDAIKQHFNVYSWQRKKNLSAVVHIDLYPNGRVRQRRIITPSSDPLFDSNLLQGIDEAQPLPLPDDPALLSDGIDIKFTP